MKKKHLGIIFGVALALAAGIILYRWRTSSFSWQEFGTSLVSVDWTWMALGMAAVLATYVGRALRWEIMLRPVAPNTSLLRILSATCIGFTAVVLFGRAGEPVRPYLISKREGVTFSSQIAAWVVERILDLLMVLVIFGIALTRVGHSGIQPGPKVQTLLEAGGYMAGVTGFLCLALLIALRQFRGAVRERLLEALTFLPQPALVRVNKFLGAFEEGMQSTRSPVLIWKLVGYTVAEWGVITGAFFCVFRAFPATAGLGWNDAVIAVGFIAFGSALQIPGVGGGMQIAAAVVLTQFYGLTLEVASGIALVLWLVNFVSIVPVGLALAFYEGIKWRTLKHISDTSSGFSL